MKRLVRMLLPLMVVAAGCSGADAPSNSFDIKIKPFLVLAGSEVQNCVYLKVPSDTDVDLGKVLIDFAQGTHHMHVYYGEEQHDDGVEECFTAVDFDKWHLLVGAQKPHLEWELPEGVAFHLKAHQQLLIQVHFVNASTLTTKDGQASGSIHFEKRDPKTVKSYMGSIFGQQRGIDILPQSNFSVDGICKLPHDLNMGALAGHYHFKGQDFVANRLNDDGTLGDEFYRTENFAEPVFELFGETNPLRFKAGDRINWHCDYVNDSDMEIPFGPKELTQEHCNMFAFYYPAMGQQEFTPCVSYGRCPTECGADETCSTNGECVKACAPVCTDKQCGDDSCGGSCGSCADGSQCGSDGKCGPVVVMPSSSPNPTPSPSCVPACSGKQCGDDGCSGSCGSCADGSSCSSGMCVPATTTCSGHEVELNDWSSSATALCGPMSGTLDVDYDIDYYSFNLKVGDNYTVTLSHLPGDYTFIVYHQAASGSLTKIASPEDNGDLADQSLSSKSTTGGTYFVKVYSPYGDYDATNPYLLTVSKP